MLLAEEAAAAGDGERNDYAVTYFQLIRLDGGAYLYYFAHELVPEDVPLLHSGDVPVVQVEVGTANCGACNPHNGVAGIKNLRIRNIFDSNLFDAHPTNSFHAILRTALNESRDSGLIGWSGLRKRKAAIFRDLGPCV